ncbi:MAG: hypothetical protein RO469_00530 [Thermincola sp.]|nr:hypothetical protein [Thermincola sp.]MDT3701466.1 hypothetical protein [Thermincola sp.]
MDIVKYIEPVLYSVCAAVIILAAVNLYNQTFRGNRKHYGRLRLLSQVKAKTFDYSSFLFSNDLEKLLISAGRPLRLNSVRYNLGRLGLLGVWFIILNARWLISGSKYPSNYLFLIVGLIIFTQPMKGLPLFSLLMKITDIRAREKNKECFTLYSMIQNEFYNDVDKPQNMYSTLAKLKPYFKAIDKAMGKALLLWKRNPAEALEAFATEVGTQEAKDLAQILKNVDASSSEDAKDILDSRYEQFVTKRQESHRRYRNNVGLIGYIAALLPVFAVIYNAMVVFNLEKQDLFRFISQK